MFSVHPAEVKLAEIKVVKFSPVQQNYNLKVDIKNTDKQAIFVRTINYQFQVNGVQLSQGQAFVWLEIPALSTQQVEIAATSNIWGQLEPLYLSIKDTKQVSYYFSGQLKTGNLLFQRTSDIYHSDVLTAEQIPLKKLKKYQKYQKLLNSRR